MVIGLERVHAIRRVTDFTGTVPAFSVEFLQQGFVRHKLVNGVNPGRLTIGAARQKTGAKGE